MSIVNQAWILTTVLALGVVWIELAQRGKLGWASVPAFLLLFGSGAAWIRGYHQGGRDDSQNDAE